MFKTRKRVEKLMSVVGINDDNNQINNLKKLSERLDEIEEQLKPKPAFKKGDMVNFFLIGNEFEGEIVAPNYKMINRGMWREATDEIDSWTIAYLDKNDKIQIAAVREEDIYPQEEDAIDYLHGRINEIVLRLNKLEGIGTKKK